MKKTSIHDCLLIPLPKIITEAGSITAINGLADLPFEIKRVYYLYDVPGGIDRGGHAHKELQQLIVAASGSFDLVINDGQQKMMFNLNRPFWGVLMPSGLWRELTNFSSGSICLVLGSQEYNESDYIRDFNEYLLYKRKYGIHI